MTPNARIFLLFLAAFCTACLNVIAEEKKTYTGACLAPVDAFFKDEVWGKVGSQKCLTCHKEGGDAEDSRFILVDPKRFLGAEQDAAMRSNRDAFAKMAANKEKDQSRMLLKVVGELDHGGEDVLKPGSTGLAILQKFVTKVNTPVPPGALTVDPKAAPFFEGVAMMDDRRLLRRVTLQLAGRLPSADEDAKIAKDGLKALPAIMDGVMKEDAFYDRLREGFNDIFLTTGFDGNPDQAILSYGFFPNRQWFMKVTFDEITDPQKKRLAGYKLADEFRDGVRGESMKLIEYIVRNDRPFTEIVTADYFMVTPLSARGYGVYDQVKDKFKQPEQPFDYVPARLPRMVGRGGKPVQESMTGFYPHAGMLGLFQYLRRYPTTETNRNRLRGRMYYEHFLGVDVLELAARVSDSAAAQAKFEVPTMQAAECVVCHRTLDPVAGLFQDFWDFEGTYGQRKGGWFTDMFGPGFEGEDLPKSERWRALQWLGEKTAKDPRFAATMVGHVYYILTGRKPLLPPKDIDDPLFDARRRAYAEQRKMIEAIAVKFAKNGFNLKDVFKDLAVTDFYRVDGLAASVKDPKRLAELDDAGIVRMLAPEQLERKLAAIFGERWGKLGGTLGMLYGGIDAKAVTERATDPSGAMGAIQRILANDAARTYVPKDFAKPASQRLLFPGIESNVVPGSPESDAKIRQAIVRLHERILGRFDAPNSADVDRTFKLFAGIVQEAADRKKNGVKDEGPRSSFYSANDPNYTLRAWMGVVTYLLRRSEFLYE